VKSSLAPVRRRRKLWKAILLVMGVLVGAVWVVQAPSRPLFGLLGLLPLAMIILAINAGGARARIPILGSQNRVLAIGGWTFIGLLLVGAEFAVLSGLSLTPAASHQAQASLSSPPGASGPASSSAASSSSTSPPSAPAATAPTPAPPASSAGSAQPAPPSAAAAAPAAPAAPAPAAPPVATGPMAPILVFLAPALTLLDPTLAADLGLREPSRVRVSCAHSPRHGHAGHIRLSWASGASNGGAATWNMLQAQQCGGSR
jgi:hypothetical protein